MNCTFSFPELNPELCKTCDSVLKELCEIAVEKRLKVTLNQEEAEQTKDSGKKLLKEVTGKSFKVVEGSIAGIIKILVLQKGITDRQKLLEELRPLYPNKTDSYLRNRISDTFADMKRYGYIGGNR